MNRPSYIYIFNFAYSVKIFTNLKTKELCNVGHLDTFQVQQTYLHFRHEIEVSSILDTFLLPPGCY
jgi:hypothetical protein